MADEYKIVADKIVSHESDVVVSVSGGLYINSISNNTKVATMADVGNGGGSSADIADFVFTNVDSENSSITVTGDKELTIQSGASEDLNVRAGDDLWLTADDEIFVQADDDINLRSQGSTSILTNYVDLEGNEYVWEFGPQGYLTLPGGGEIINSPNSSGDGGGYSTLKLDPDNTLETDQYIIIDPTTGFEGPDHIHIRAGGTIDESAVNLILGGEKNAVVVSDEERAVGITSRPPTDSQALINIQTVDSAEFVTSVPDPEGVLVQTDWKVLNAGTEYTVTGVSLNTPTEGLVTITATGLTFGNGTEYTFYYDPPYVNTWAFTSEGYLYGPAMGGLYVTGIVNNEGDIYVASTQNVVLQSVNGGEFLDDPNVAGNQIATVGDLGVDTPFTVVGGTLGDAPTFTGAPLFTGSYVKTGPMVHFRIDVDFDNITSFGTGQYYLDLPFPAKYNYEFTAGCLHDISATRDYPMTGHIYAGESRMLLKSLDASGNSAYAVPFTATAPVTLTTADNFHIAGEYIWEPEAP